MSMTKEQRRALADAYHDRISEHVEQIRAARGWSIRDAAERFSMNYSNLAHKLRGINQWTLEDIAVIERVAREKLIEVL